MENPWRVHTSFHEEAANFLLSSCESEPEFESEQEKESKEEGELTEERVAYAERFTGESTSVFASSFIISLSDKADVTKTNLT